MYARSFAVVTLIAASAMLAACSSDNTLGLGVAGTSADSLSNARIRFVNATATSLDVVTNGVVGAGNGGIGFGTSSSCLSVNATSPKLAVRVAGTSSALPGFTTAYQSGVSYTVIAYTGAGGATLFATIADIFTPVAGQGALRVFNASAAGTSYDVYVTPAGESLTAVSPKFSAVTAGNGTSFINVEATTSQQVRVTAAGSKIVLLDVGSATYVAGQNVTLVIAPPLAGSTAPRGFLVAGC
jgi:hypothetical protein